MIEYNETTSSEASDDNVTYTVLADEAFCIKLVVGKISVDEKHQQNIDIKMIFYNMLYSMKTIFIILNS